MTDTHTLPPPTRRDDSPSTPGWLTAGAIAAAALEACGGGGGSSGSSGGTGSGTVAGGSSGPLGQTYTYAMPANDADAARFLLQAQFSASDAEIASVRSMGYARWLAQQFAAPAGTTAWDWLNSRGYATIDGNIRYYDSSYPADYALWWQLFNSTDALRKRVALALSEIFVVSTNGMDVLWPSHVIAAWWDMLSAGAFGTFRTLLENVTLHPAMGVYLNIRGSQKENSAGRQPDENYAREVMQLMTLGLSRLNPDGSLLGGVQQDTYTQSDITNLARVFTGYDFDMTQNVNTNEPVQSRTIGNTAFARLPMVLKPSLHSTNNATFLDTTISGSTEGNAARRQALDVLANHANVGPFIGRQLIQRLVTSNPSPAYIGRVSAVFADNGQGVRGDLGAVVAAILLDDEARGPAGLSSTTFGRLREPMLRMVQWGRSFGLNSARGSWKIGDQSSTTGLGQSPLRSASVFNFFRPGYVPPSTSIASSNLVAPEFQLVNETAVSAYVNYVQNTAQRGYYVNAPDLPQSASNANNGFDITAAYTAERALVGDPAALVARLNLVLAAGQLSQATVNTIVGAISTAPLTTITTDANKLARICAAVLMVMASSEYLVQK